MSEEGDADAIKDDDDSGNDENDNNDNDDDNVLSQSASKRV